jgi:hypothetical protein
VAGLVAYLRALPSPFANDLKRPEFAVSMVDYLSRKITALDEDTNVDYGEEQEFVRRRVIWNGNVGLDNCLTGYYTGHESAEVRSICGPVIRGLPKPGSTDNWTPGSNEGGSDGVTWSVHALFFEGQRPAIDY